MTLHTDLGDLDVALFFEAAPVTAANFLDLVGRGFYNGTRFTRIESGYLMQGGDGASRPGGARAGFTIPDELHHALRHDERGRVAMATAAPNAGNSQFYITFIEEAPWLDDRYTVFGQVTPASMPVLDRIERLAAGPDGTPAREVVLTGAEAKRLGTGGDPGRIGAWSPDGVNTVPSGASGTSFLVVAENCSGVPQHVGLELESQQTNWVVEAGHGGIDLPAGQRVAFSVHVTLRPEDPDVTTATLTVSGRTSTVFVPLEARRHGEAGPKVADGDTVRLDYIAMTTDGRVTDTTLPAVGEDPRVPRFRTFHRNPSNYAPFEFVTGPTEVCGERCAIVGLHDAMADVRVGETQVHRIPAERGFQCDPQGLDCLYGRELLFQVQVLSARQGTR